MRTTLLDTKGMEMDKLRDTLYEDLPVQTPRLLKVRSTVVRCASCGMWITRFPSFFGAFEGFFHCEKCGRTGIVEKEGRPYGPKSQQWDWIVDEFNHLFFGLETWDFESVVCDPPLESLDWKAIDDWFHSKNIFRAPRTGE